MLTVRFAWRERTGSVTAREKKPVQYHKMLVCLCACVSFCTALNTHRNSLFQNALVGCERPLNEQIKTEKQPRCQKRTTAKREREKMRE